MKYDNPDNDPIVGFENSTESLKLFIASEGMKAENKNDCPYAEQSTFREWWMMGFNSF